MALLQVLFLLLACLCLYSLASRAEQGDILLSESTNTASEGVNEKVVIHHIKVPEKCEHKVKSGDTVGIIYTVKIHASSKHGVHGSIVDANVSRGGKPRPFRFKAGSNAVIAGLNEGIMDMCLSEKRVLVIPPAFGYGEEGQGKVPGGATLEFQVEVVTINDVNAVIEGGKKNVFKEMDQNRDGRIVYEEMHWWFANMHPNKLDSIPSGVWERDDRNMDGFITLDEFSGPKGEL